MLIYTTFNCSCFIAPVNFLEKMYKFLIGVIRGRPNRGWCYNYGMDIRCTLQIRATKIISQNSQVIEIPYDRISRHDDHSAA